MSSSRVYITGIGIISAIGINREENLRSLLSRQDGITYPEILQTVHREEIPAGEIKKDNRALAELAGVTIDKAFSRTALLGMIAAQEAVQHAGLTKEDLRDTGIISATTVGGMDRTELLYRNITPENRHFILSHVCGDSTENIADHLGLTDFVSTLSTACSSSANAIMRGAEMIQKKMVPRIIAGGTDALSRFTFNGFRSLMILSKAPSRPFDAHRDGLNLGEGAAYLILEGEASVRGREEKILGEVAGFGNANDAFHQTASSPEGEGAWRAMSSALHNAGLSPAKIDYVNAHGTGTPNNDLSELRGLVHLFGEALPPFSSTKPYTGHTLGAAGAIEAVFSVFSLIHQVVFPNLNFEDKMEEVPVLPETNLLTDKKLNTILSNSFGFGGNDTSLIFRRHEGIH